MNPMGQWSADEIARVRARAPSAADEDIAEVLTRYQERGDIRNPVGFAVSAVNGGLDRDLADAADRRRKAAVRQANDERRSQPPCEHGEPGGNLLRPDTGLPWCPQCRHLAKAQQADSAASTPARSGEHDGGDPGQASGTARDRETPEEQEDEIVLPAVPVFPHDQARGPLRDLLDWAAEDGLPVSYVAAAAEVAAAGAAASGPGAELQLTGARIVRPIMWQVLIGESGDGKNPSIRHATAPAARYYREQLARSQKDPAQPRPQALMQSSISTEALARWLDATNGAGIISNGELASFLRGLGQYKKGGGSDRFDVMDMWSGEPISIERVGQGGRKNAIGIYVPEPRLSLIGGLVPENLKVLGSESDGLRARFLPALPSTAVIPRMNGGEDIPASYDDAIRQLYECQDQRQWTLSRDAESLITAAVKRWTGRKNRGTDPVTVRTALAKADEHCLRIALAVSELAEPGKGGEVPRWAAAYAIARVDYGLGCWLALGTDQTMAFSRKDEVTNAAVADLLRLIGRRTVPAGDRQYLTRRDIQQSKVGGASAPYLVDHLIRAYLRAYPQSVTVCTETDLAKFPGARVVDRAEMPESGSRGPAPVIVYAPRRDQ